MSCRGDVEDKPSALFNLYILWLNIGLLSGQRLGPCAQVSYRKLLKHRSACQWRKRSAADQYQLETGTSAAVASPPGIKTDGNVAHNLPTCSWPIKTLIAAYGVRDVCFMLWAGTKDLCNHQVSLLWSFKSSLCSHYIPLMRRCSGASDFKLWWLFLCC